MMAGIDMHIVLSISLILLLELSAGHVRVTRNDFCNVMCLIGLTLDLLHAFLQGTLKFD